MSFTSVLKSHTFTIADRQGKTFFSIIPVVMTWAIYHGSNWVLHPVEQRFSYFGSLKLSYHWQRYHTSTFFHVAAILDFAIDTLKVSSPIGLKCGVLLQVKGLFLGERTHDIAKNIHTSLGFLPTKNRVTHDRSIERKRFKTFLHQSHYYACVVRRKSILDPPKPPYKPI